jgi:integrase
MPKNIQCIYCLKELSKKNIKSHEAQFCVVKNCFNKTYQQIREVLENCPSSEVDELNKTIDKYKNDIVKLYEENTLLKEQVAELSAFVIVKTNDGPQKYDVIKTNENIKIGVMKNPERKDHVSKAKLAYWDKYVDYCNTKSLCYLLPSNANDYITHLVGLHDKTKKKTYSYSTINKIKGILQSILREQVDVGITLRRVKAVPKKEKVYLTEKQISEITASVKDEKELSLVIDLLKETGLRVNAVAMLKRDNVRTKIHHPYIYCRDYKVDKDVTSYITKDLAKRLDEFIDSKQIQDDQYIFNSGFIEEDYRKRAPIIAKQLKAKTSFTKDDNQTIHATPHMFRTQACNVEMESQYLNILTHGQNKLGHSHNTTTKMHYAKFPNLESIAQEVATKHQDQQEGKLLIVNNYNNALDTYKTSLADALKNQELCFNDDLVYEDPISPDDILISGIQVLSPQNVVKFKQLKNQSMNMDYGPFKVVSEGDKRGYFVIAAEAIRQNTLICEYSGVVRKYAKVENEESNDCLFDFLTIRKGNTKIEYVIDPKPSANLGKYVAGINNEKEKKEHNQNVYSIKTMIDNSIHILLIALKAIKKNEILCYDYNADKSEYDTSYFI